MTPDQDLKVVTAAEFNQIVTKFSELHGISLLDSVEHYMLTNEIEPETIASLVQRSQSLKARIAEEAQELNLIEKDTHKKLPV